MTVSRRLTAEFLGTAFLVAAVIGSGIMGERLAEGNVALALLANTIGHRRRTRRSDSHLRPHFWRAPESRRHSLHRSREWNFLAGIPAVRRGPNSRRHYRRSGGAFNVRPDGSLSLASRTQRPRSISERVHRHVWAALRDLGMLAFAAESSSIRRGRLHHRSLLVHLVHLIRKSRGHNRQVDQRHVCRHPPQVTRRCSWSRNSLERSAPRYSFAG